MDIPIVKFSLITMPEANYLSQYSNYIYNYIIFIFVPNSWIFRFTNSLIHYEVKTNK
jgi:hypothetical protein